MSRRRRGQAQHKRTVEKAALPARIEAAGGKAVPIGPAQQRAAQQAGGLSPWMYGGAPFDPMPRTDPSVPFGPGVPLIPAPLDPPGSSGRPGPRQWEYPISWNLPGFGERHLPWGTLRAAARVDIVRDCISVIKKELTGLDWSIAIAEDAIEDLVQSGKAERRTEAKRMLREKLQPDITRARGFWRRPDPANGMNFQDWFWAVLEEILVLDALPIYPYASLTGSTLGLRIIDGSTIKPLIDHQGLRPAPPQPAFQQLLHGFPRGEFTAAADKDGTIDNSYSADELVYCRREVRASSPYGFSPVETALSRINLWLKRVDWMTKEWDSGSLPQAMMEVPEGSRMDPAELIRWREAINSHLGGDNVERHRIQVSIPGGKLTRFTDAADAYKPDYDVFLVKILCSAFGIAPAEIGFIETGGLGGASYHEGQADIQNRKGIAPWVRWFEELFRDINIRYLQLDPAVEFRFEGLKKDDEAARDGVVAARVASGRMTLNEARDEQGMPPYTFAEADQPYVQTGAGLTFLEGQREIADAQAQAQVAGAEMAAQNLKAGKLPSGKDPNTPKAEREDGDDPRPQQGTPSAAGTAGGKNLPPPTAASAAKADAAAIELDAFGRWALKAAKSRSPRRPFTFTAVDEDIGRRLNTLAAGGLTTEAASLAKAEAADLRKKFDPHQLRDWHGRWGSSGGAPSSPLVEQHDSPLPRRQMSLDELQSIHGGRIAVDSPDDPKVQRLVAALGRIPESHHRMVAEHMEKKDGRIVLGPQRPQDHPEAGDDARKLRDPNLVGVYIATSRDMYASSFDPELTDRQRNRHISGATEFTPEMAVTHEFGHALDFAGGLASLQSSFKGLARNTAAKNKVSPYFKQPFGLGQIETWAQSYGAWVVHNDAPNRDQRIGEGLGIRDPVKAQQAGAAIGTWLDKNIGDDPSRLRGMVTPLTGPALLRETIE